MNSTVYTNFKKNAGAKMENLSSDSLSVLLMGAGYSPSIDNDCAYHLATPAQPTVTASGTGGSVPAGTYGVKITYVNPAGETIASSYQSVAVTSGQNIVITSPSTPSPLCSCTGWYAYVTQAGATLTTNSNYTRQQTAGSPTALGTNLTISANPTTSGAVAPTSSTADIIANEVYNVNTNGYSVGGASIGSVTYSKVTAATFTRAWMASTDYSIGQLIVPASSPQYVYMCVQAGSSGSSAPTFGTALDALTNDGTVIWQCVASSVVVLSGSNITWNVTGSIVWRYAVAYDVTTGDLIALLDPGSSQTGPSSGTISIDWDTASGILTLI